MKGEVAIMRHLRFWINVLIFVLPLVILGEWALSIVRGAWRYLNTNARIANAVSVEATRQLGREVHIRDVRFTGNLWSLAAQNGVELLGVSVADVPGSANGTFVLADRVAFQYSISQLILTNNLQVPLIDALQLDHLQLSLARNGAGKWNFADLIKPQKPSSRPFVNAIKLRNAVINYHDQDFPRIAGASSGPFESRVDSLSGVILLHPDHSVAVDLAGIADTRYAHDFHLIGIYRPRPQQATVRLAVNQVNLPAVGPRLIAPDRMAITSGRANVDINVIYEPGDPATLFGVRSPVTPMGHIEFSDLSLTGKLLGAPAQHLTGQADLAGDSLFTDLHGTYAGTGVQVHGKVVGISSPSAKSSVGAAALAPALDVEGDVLHTDVGPLVHALSTSLLARLPANVRANIEKIQAPGNFHFQASGAMYNPTVAITANLDRIGWSAYHAENVTGQALYHNMEITTDMRGSFADGSAALRANIGLDSIGAFQIEAHIRKLHIAQVGLPPRIPATGNGDLDFTMHGVRGRTPIISAQAQVYGAKIYNIPLNTLYARAETRGRDLMVSVLRAQDPRGYLVGRGKVNLTNQALDINLDADNIDLSYLLAYLQKTPSPLRNGAQAPRVPVAPILTPEGLLAGDTSTMPAVQGIGYLRSHISGTLTQPRLLGRVSAFAVQAKNFGVDKIVADLDLTRQRLLVTEGKAQRYLGLVRFSGVVTEPFTKTPYLRLTVGADNLDLADILRTAGVDLTQMAVTGSLYADNITVEGMLNSLRVNQPFTISLENASVNGQSVTDAALQGRYDGTYLDILSATANLVGGPMKLPGGSLAASGRISRSGDLDLTAHVRALDLQNVTGLLPTDLPYELQGHASVDATVQGTIHDPDVHVITDTDGFAVDDYILGHLHAEAGYANSLAHLRNVEITEPAPGVGKFHAGDLVYNTKTEELGGTADWTQLSVQRIRELAQTVLSDESEQSQKIRDALSQIAGPIEGVISGSLQLSGNKSHPIVAANWNASNLRIDNYPITLFTGRAIVDDKHAQIPDAQLTSSDAGIEIDATGIDAVYDGPLKGEVTAYKMDLGFLQRWIQQIHTSTATTQSRVTAQVGGQGDVGIVASGTTKSPVLDISINLRNVSYLDPRLPKSTFPTIDHIDMDHAVIKEGSIAGTLRLLTKDTTTDKPVTYDIAAHGSLGFSWTPPYIPTDAALDLATGLDSRQPITLPFQAISFFAPYAFLAAKVDPGQAASKLLSDSDGSFSFNASVTQTLDAPLFTGEVDVAAKRLKLRDFQTGLSDVSGAFELQQDRVAVRSGFQARSQVYVKGVPDPKQVGAPIRIVGELPLGFGDTESDTAGQITVATDKFVFNETPLPGTTSGGAHGDALVAMKLTGSVKELRVGGDITIRDVMATLPSQFSAATPGRTAQSPYPQLDLAIHLDRNNRIVNPQLNALIAGNVNVSGSLSDPHLQGLLELQEGRLTLPTARFTIITPSTLSLLYPIYESGQLDLPSLQLIANIQAQTYLSATSIEGVGRRYKVTVTARGPLTGMSANPVTGQTGLTLNFQTDPPDLATNQLALNQRLTGILSGTDTFNQMGRNPTQALADELTNVFSNSVLPGIFDRTAEKLGFDTLEINYDPIQRLNFTISRRLIGPLYASYFRTLTADAIMYDFKVSLRLNRRYQVSYDANELNIQSYLLEGVWHF